MSRRFPLLAPLTLLPLLAGLLAAGLPLRAGSLPAEQARQAANAILAAIRSRNGAQLHGLLADPVRQATTVARVQQRLNAQPRFEGAAISGVIQGVDDTTVETELRRAGSSVPLTLVLDPSGRLLAWQLEEPVAAIAAQARRFVEDLAAGRLVLARSQLSLAMQQELPPKALAAKWQNLQRLTGPYQRIRGTLLASSGGDQQLVLVTTEFGRLTDNLFVIFDRDGRIIGVDFPRSSAT